MERAMVFIDLNNVSSDYRLVTNGDCMEITSYLDKIAAMFPELSIRRNHVFLTETGSNGGFITYLQHIPNTKVTLGRLQSKSVYLVNRGGEYESANGVSSATVEMRTDKKTDSNLIVKMLVDAFNDNYDTAILISRDADFVPAVEAVQNLGKRVELVLFEDVQNTAQELSMAVDDVKVISSDEYNSIAKQPSERTVMAEKLSNITCEVA